MRRRHGDELAALCDEIAAAGGSARGFETDARSEDQVVELFDRVESELGAPDDVAATYLAVRQQPRSAWTFELDLRPWVERW